MSLLIKFRLPDLTEDHIWRGDPVHRPDEVVLPEDGAVDTPSLRTLGTGALQAAPGSHPEVEATRTVLAHIRVGENLDVDNGTVRGPTVIAHPDVRFEGALVEEAVVAVTTARRVKFNPTGDRIGVAESVSPFVRILEYDKEAGTLVSVVTFNPHPSGEGNAFDWHPDGDRFGVRFNWTPGYHLYSFVKATNAYALVAAYTATQITSNHPWSSSEFNSAGDRIAIPCHPVAPNPFHIIRFDKAAGTLHFNAAIALPDGASYAAWNAGQDRIALGYWSAPSRLRILGYNKLLASITTIAEAIDVGSSCWFTDWHKDMDRVVAVSSQIVYVLAYDRTAGTLSVIATYDVGGNAFSAKFNPDGDLIAVAHSVAPHFTLLRFDKSLGTLTVERTFTTVGSGTCSDWHPDGDRIAVGTTSHIHILKGDETAVVSDRLKHLTVGMARYSMEQPIGMHNIVFHVPGPLDAGANVTPVFIVPTPLEVHHVRCYAKTAPDGDDIIVDVNRDGVTIFTTQANRPIIPDGDNLGPRSETPDVTVLEEGHIITLDIDQVGTIEPGEDLTVEVRCRFR